MRWMIPLGILVPVACLLGGCTSGVVVRNELAYPITVRSFESGNPPLSQLPISSSMLLSADSPSGSLNEMEWSDRRALLDVASGESGMVTKGGQFNDPSGRKSVNLLLTPASAEAAHQAAWTNCAVSMPPPLGPMVVTIVLRRRNDGSGLLEVEASDQLGNLFEGVFVAWNVAGAEPATVSAGHQ